MVATCRAPRMSSRTEVGVPYPRWLATDNASDLYILEGGTGRIRHVDGAGRMATYVDLHNSGVISIAFDGFKFRTLDSGL